MRRGIMYAEPSLLAEVLRVADDSKYALASIPCEMLHAALLLPVSYRVVGIDFDRAMYTYRIYLESEHLPEATDGYFPATVHPTYTRYTPESEPPYTRLTSLTADGKQLPLE